MPLAVHTRASSAADGRARWCGADKGLVEIRAPKYGSERKVHLADGLVEMLSARLAAHCPGTDPGRFVFGFGQDVPPDQNTVGFWWRKARAAAGCDAVKLHDLRHFYASGLIAAGATW